MKSNETFVITKGLDNAIEFSTDWWGFPDFVHRQEAKRLADAIDGSMEKIKQTANEFCERFPEFLPWHDEHDPDELLRGLADFARRTGFETRYGDRHLTLFARSDEELIPLLKAEPTCRLLELADFPFLSDEK